MEMKCKLSEKKPVLWTLVHGVWAHVELGAWDTPGQVLLWFNFFKLCLAVGLDIYGESSC